MNTFHNTIHLSGEDLKKAITDAMHQEDVVYMIFCITGSKFTASDITIRTESAGKKWPIWSNRRAITNLMNKGKLAKLNEKKDGPMGKPEHYYQVLIKTDNELQEWFSQYQEELPPTQKPKWTEQELFTTK
jgi:hypothetical protein